jgi:hypothetical protein
MSGIKNVKRDDTVYTHGAWAVVLRVDGNEVVLSGGQRVRLAELDFFGHNSWRHHPAPISDETAQPPGEWPEDLRGAFWSAVNAPTYAESAALTLAFVHALAEYIRSDPECEVGSYGDGLLDAALMVDPEALS